MLKDYTNPNLSSQVNDKFSNYLSERMTDQSVAYNTWVAKTSNGVSDRIYRNTMAAEGKIWDLIPRSNCSANPERDAYYAKLDTQIIPKGIQHKLTSHLNQDFRLSFQPAKLKLSETISDGEREQFSHDVSQLEGIINTELHSFMSGSINMNLLKRAITTGFAGVWLNFDDKGMIGIANSELVKNTSISYQFVDPESIYIDPLAFNLESASHILIVTRTDMDYINQHFPNFDLDGTIKEVGSDIKEYCEGGINGYKDLMYDIDITRSLLTLSPMSLADLNSDKVDLMIKCDKVYDKVANKTKLRVKYYAGWFLLKELTLDIDFYPLEILYYEKFNQEPYGRSCVDKALPVSISSAKALSEYSLQAIKWANPDIIINTNADLDVKALTTGRSNNGGTILPVNPDSLPGQDLSKAVYIVPVPEPSQGVLSIYETCSESAREIMGINSDVINGTASTNGARTGAMSSMVDQAYRTDEVFQSQINEFLTKVSVKLFGLMKAFGQDGQYYSRNTNFNNNVSSYYPTLNNSLVWKHEFVAYFNVRPRSRDKKAQDFEKLVQLTNLQPLFRNDVLVTAPELIRASGLDNSDDIIVRLNEDNQVILRAKATEMLSMAAQEVQLHDKSIQAGQGQRGVNGITNTFVAIMGNQVSLPEAVQANSQRIQQEMTQLEQSTASQQGPQQGQGNQGQGQ